MLETTPAQTLSRLADISLYMFGLDGAYRNLLSFQVIEKAARSASMVRKT
jgi:hypothetical protein